MALVLTPPILCRSSPPTNNNINHNNKLHFKSPRLSHRRSPAAASVRAASPNQEPVKAEEEAGVRDEPAEVNVEEELTEWEKSLGKFFRSRLWFVFLGCFFVGLYVFFITSGNGGSYIPMVRYQYTYQR